VFLEDFSKSELGMNELLYYLLNDPNLQYDVPFWGIFVREAPMGFPEATLPCLSSIPPCPPKDFSQG